MQAKISLKNGVVRKTMRYEEFKELEDISDNRYLIDTSEYSSIAFYDGLVYLRKEGELLASKIEDGKLTKPKKVLGIPGQTCEFCTNTEHEGLASEEGHFIDVTGRYIFSKYLSKWGVVHYRCWRQIERAYEADYQYREDDETKPDGAE